MKKPDDPNDFLCRSCGDPGPWANPDQVASWNVRMAARHEHEELLKKLAAGEPSAPLAPLLASSASAAAYDDAAELRALHLKALQQVATAAVADDILTPEEDAALNSLLTVLGIGWNDLRAFDPALGVKAAVASVNGGMLPEVQTPHILPKRGEIAHLECNASLMKEVAIREYQGGYSGFSFPIGKTGVRYRVGGSRGHSVEVGTKLNVADSGILTVTNKRVVYAGARKTLDMPYSKLINLSVFSDGIQFHLSNRVNAPLFHIQQGSDLIAAIVNAAAQRAE